jgi:hypothetical protein
LQEGHQDMNHSRVALLLALALMSRTANAWIIDSRPVTPSTSTISMPPISFEAVLRMDPFPRTGCWPGDKIDSRTCPYVVASSNNPYFYDCEKALRLACSLLPGGNNSEKLGINQRLVRLFRRNVSLLTIIDVRKALDSASHYWQQTVAFCCNYEPSAGKAGLAASSAIDDLFGTMSNPCPAENLRLVDGGLSRLEVIEFLYPGSWPNDSAKPWFFASETLHGNGTHSGSLSTVWTMATRFAGWANMWFEGWEVAFRNTSHGFARLNWTILLPHHIGGKDTGNAMLTPRIVDR